MKSYNYIEWIAVLSGLYFLGYVPLAFYTMFINPQASTLIQYFSAAWLIAFVLFMVCGYYAWERPKLVRP